MLRFFYNDENAIVICCEPTKNVEFPLTYSSDNPANQQHSFLQLRFSTVYSTTRWHVGLRVCGVHISASNTAHAVLYRLSIFFTSLSNSYRFTNVYKPPTSRPHLTLLSSLGLIVHGWVAVPKFSIFLKVTADPCRHTHTPTQKWVVT